MLSHTRGPHVQGDLIASAPESSYNPSDRELLEGGIQVQVSELGKLEVRGLPAHLNCILHQTSELHYGFFLQIEGSSPLFSRHSNSIYIYICPHTFIQLYASPLRHSCQVTQPIVKCSEPQQLVHMHPLDLMLHAMQHVQAYVHSQPHTQTQIQS